MRELRKCLTAVGLGLALQLEAGAGRAAHGACAATQGQEAAASVQAPQGPEGTAASTVHQCVEAFTYCVRRAERQWRTARDECFLACRCGGSQPPSLVQCRRVTAEDKELATFRCGCKALACIEAVTR